MLIQGLKFGLLLQLAVGPVCLMVFNTASNIGLLAGLTMALAVTLVDTLYIGLAGLGLTGILRREKLKKILKIFGCLVLVMFGLNNIAGALSYQLIPDINLFAADSQQGVFLQGLILTMSNPMTIIFWGGIFSAQVLERNLDGVQLLYFAIGCILSTLVFISFIAFLGSVVNQFLSREVVNMLNLSIGVLIVYFGVKLVVPRHV
mgnify:CR=1 FL=1